MKLETTFILTKEEIMKAIKEHVGPKLGLKVTVTDFVPYPHTTDVTNFKVTATVEPRPYSYDEGGR